MKDDVKEFLQNCVNDSEGLWDLLDYFLQRNKELQEELENMKARNYMLEQENKDN